MYELAKDKDVLFHSTIKHILGTFTHSDGETISNELSNKLSDLFLNIYDGADFKEEKEHFNSSFGNFFAKK